VDDRLRKRHRLQDDRVGRVAQGVAGRGVLEADERVDVAHARLVDRVLLVGVHLEELPDALLLALGRVDDLSAGGHLARVHPDVGELAEERVRRDLEGQRGEGLGHVGLADDDGVGVADRVALDRRDVERGRQVVDDGVEHGLNALVLERRTAQDRVDLAGDHHLADGTLDLLGRELLAAEELLEQRLVALGHGLEQPLAVLLDLDEHVLRDVLDRVVLALGRLSAPGERAVVDEVDDADEVALGPDGQLDRQRPRAEALGDGAHGEVEVRAELVHLVDEADAGDVVLVRLPPHRLGLRLDPFLAVEDGDGAVENAQRALDLDREVHVTGRVDDVDLGALPEARRRGGRDRDTALLLLLHPVHRRGPVVDLADLVVDPGVEQDPLGGRGLAGVDVRHDADVPDLLEVRQHVQCHGCQPRLVLRVNRSEC
jgi:hypothetical protein